MTKISEHRVLVSGAGSIGVRHLKNLRALGISTLAFADPGPPSEGLSALQQEGSLQAFTEYEKALSEFKPTIVFLCSPTAFHIAQATLAARAGCHLFIEKPLSLEKTVLVVPLNDPEAILIYEIAKAMGIQVIRSAQPHGAALDREPDLVPLIRDGGWKRVVIIEMPGPKVEAKLRALGVGDLKVRRRRNPFTTSLLWPASSMRRPLWSLMGDWWNYLPATWCKG